MDVPLIMVVEFMVFLAYDGKLESNSDMEKELSVNSRNDPVIVFSYLYIGGSHIRVCHLVIGHLVTYSNVGSPYYANISYIYKRNVTFLMFMNHKL